MTGAEVVEMIDATEARALVDELADHVEMAGEIARRLFVGRGWVALGYGSWSDLCDAELVGRIPATPEMHAALRAEGMSVRAIARTTGAPKSNVARQVSHYGTPDAVGGEDGKQYPAQAAPSEYVCGICGKDCRTSALYVRHRRQEHTTARTDIQCQRCGEWVPEAAMSDHDTEHHPAAAALAAVMAEPVPGRAERIEWEARLDVLREAAAALGDVKPAEMIDHPDLEALHSVDWAASVFAAWGADWGKLRHPSTGSRHLRSVDG